MADQKISDDPVATDLVGALIPIVQSGQNKAAPSSLFAAVGGDGPPGRPAGLAYQFDDATSGDPGSGHFGFNNATIASATSVRLSETDGDGVGIAALLATFDDSTTTAARGVLMFRKVGTPGAFAAFQITSAITDSGAYDSFTVSHIVSAGTFTDEDAFTVEFYRTGNTGSAGSAGAAGANGGVTYTYSTTTTDTDPGNGAFRFNAAIASATGAFIDNQDTNAVSMTAWLDSFDDSTTTTNKGFLIFKGVTQASAIAIFKVTGSVVDGTGYRKVTLTYVAHGGTWTNGNTFSLLFMATGDKGADGVGAGDVVGPASAVDNRIVVYDSTTGKLIKDGGSTIQNLIDAIDGKQASDTDLTAIAALTTTSYGRGLMTLANAAALGSELSAIYQPLDSDLTAIAALTTTSYGRAFLALANQAALMALLSSSSTTVQGIVELATAAEFRTGTDTARAVGVAEVWSAADWFGLTDGATITVNMASFLSLASVALAGNRSFGTPSNAKPGQNFIFKVTATTSTRTLTLPGAFVLGVGVEAGPYSITTSETVFVCGFVDTSSVLRVTAVLRF